MTATAMVWSAAGSPDPPEALKVVDHPGLCAVCGEHADRTGPVKTALGKNFSDPYLLGRADSDRVCVACAWCCSGKPPATLRMWSLVVRPDAPPSAEKAWLQVPGLCLTSRGDPRPVSSTLLNPPAGEWLVTVAISGQKHVVPFAHPNMGAGPWTVRMENTDVTSTPAEFATVIEAAAALRSAGHSTQAVLDLNPSMPTMRTIADVDHWRTWATVLAPYRRSPLLDLALWALTKETICDHTPT